MPARLLSFLGSILFSRLVLRRNLLTQSITNETIVQHAARHVNNSIGCSFLSKQASPQARRALPFWHCTRAIAAYVQHAARITEYAFLPALSGVRAQGGRLVASPRVVVPALFADVVHGCLDSGMGRASVAPLRSGGGVLPVYCACFFATSACAGWKGDVGAVRRPFRIHAPQARTLVERRCAPRFPNAKGAPACVPYLRTN